mgnify:CR=1 FL=1
MSENLSYWEKEIWIGKPDVLVVGAGITGLSAALELKNTHPAMDVLVVDRGYLPTGASTKNAGFACFGSLSELQDDIDTIGWEATLQLVMRRWQGLQYLRKLIGDKALDFKACGGYEIFQPHQQEEWEAALALLPQMNQRLKEASKSLQNSGNDLSAEAFANGAVFAERPLHPAFNRHYGMIENKLEGALNPGMMMQALLRKAQKAGVRILWGLKVENWVSNGESWRVTLGEKYTLNATKVLVCTNGLAGQLIHLPVRPVRNQVLITEPISSLRWEGTFHLERGYYYFRNVGQRVLIGGGRHLAGEEENTEQLGTTAPVQRRLEELLRTLILPEQDFKVAQRWSGILGVGDSRAPLLEECKPGLYCAVRLGGMGVALGSLLGKDAAKLVLGKYGTGHR